jgi:hypothetical protein
MHWVKYSSATLFKSNSASDKELLRDVCVKYTSKSLSSKVCNLPQIEIYKQIDYLV